MAGEHAPRAAELVGDEPDRALRLDRQVEGTYLLHTEAVALTFTEPEVRAFVSGIRDHEFESAAYDSPTAA